MRKISTFLMLVAIAFSAHSNIPNASFETWNTDILEYPSDIPFHNYSDDFSYQAAGLLEKTEVSSDGDYALTLNGSEFTLTYILYGTLGDGGPDGGVAFDDNPDSVRFSFMGNFEGSDSVQIWVWKYNKGSVVAADVVKIGSNHDQLQDTVIALTNYTGLVHDELLFGIILGDPFNEIAPNEGTSFTIDHVQFIGGTNGNQLDNNSFEIWETIPLDLLPELYIDFADIQKSEDAYDGDYALRLAPTNIEWDSTDQSMRLDSEVTLWGDVEFVKNGEDYDAIYSGGLPVDQRLDTLYFHYKYETLDPTRDSARIALHFVKDGETTYYASTHVFKTVGYQQGFLPFNLDNGWQGPAEADSIILAIEALEDHGNFLEEDLDIAETAIYLDNLYFANPPITTGIFSNLAINTAHFYPNPANETLIFNGIPRSSQLEIIAIDGKVKLDEVIQPAAKVDISNLHTGLYFVKVNGKVVDKLIIK